jgi:hypothetical protein
MDQRNRPVLAFGSCVDARARAITRAALVCAADRTGSNPGTRRPFPSSPLPLARHQRVGARDMANLLVSTVDGV